MTKPLAVLAVALLCFSCASKKEPQAITTSTPVASSSSNCQDRTLPTPTPEASTSTTKPTITVPDGPPPCKLVIEDIHVGDGAEAKSDSTVTVQYVGVSWSNHKQFDASWDHGGAISFPLSGVVPGWQQGIPGMKEGGRRELIIPPSLGYGEAGSPQGGIGPNETLVFIVDLVKVGAAATSGPGGY
jgi:FKBP-type peptidyl-prolyl cis-trans isomerase